MPRKEHKANIEQAISTLVEATRDQLAVLWTSRNGSAPPKGCGRTLLELAEAYGIQTQTFGRLKPSMRRKLGAKAIGISGGVVERKERQQDDRGIEEDQKGNRVKPHDGKFHFGPRR